MLSHDFKCIFVHIPKTAGQSIESLFLGLLGLDWEQRGALLLRSNDSPEMGPPYLAHLKASEYVSCGYIPKARYNSYLKFAFVRNPWERLVSEYKYRGLPREMSFKSYLFKHLPSPGWSDHYRHIMPQYDYLYDMDGNCLIDFIGGFEELEIDFKEVCQQLNISQCELEHVNKSTSTRERPAFLTWYKHYLLTLPQQIRYVRNTFAHYTEYYDKESKEFVEEMYINDIDNFNYKFSKH